MEQKSANWRRGSSNFSEIAKRSRWIPSVSWFHALSSSQPLVRFRPISAPRRRARIVHPT